MSIKNENTLLNPNNNNNNNNNNNHSNNQISQQQQPPLWDTQSKCILLESIGKFLPLGVNKQFSIINCTVILHEKMPQKNFSYEQVYKEISEYYNLDELDDDVIDEDEKELFYLPASYKTMMDEKVKKK
ncbi:hypothetical protein DICPUDRAFT_95588 [Dictyostelium purpureum]|uniref:Uncharacterized protein n=1 Tax=Dictyostelium purpureum TaxID=5786 RepID=F0ZY61_DICPU|nr:uncharacterized protein DICPUDRAFT_95588 [Dictyostelium purpureum]EGC31106.1 hypothetical protein DICPUDRAFT_95588 [Dictyostelium purpureum]|eukprot:XP_003292355.1 hypothetical protein DICPUDRAFT_95588 [Dictyostelium purpureum]